MKWIRKVNCVEGDGILENVQKGGMKKRSKGEFLGQETAIVAKELAEKLCEREIEAYGGGCQREYLRDHEKKDVSFPRLGWGGGGSSGATVAEKGI